MLSIYKKFLIKNIEKHRHFRMSRFGNRAYQTLTKDNYFRNVPDDLDRIWSRTFNDLNLKKELKNMSISELRELRNKEKQTIKTLKKIFRKINLNK